MTADLLRGGHDPSSLLILQSCMCTRETMALLETRSGKPTSAFTDTNKTREWLEDGRAVDGSKAGSIGPTLSFHDLALKSLVIYFFLFFFLHD
jgi:hypothetical protein